jgi:hypothetical protein
MMNNIAIIMFVLLLSGCTNKGSVADLRQVARSGNDSKWSNLREEPEKNSGQNDSSYSDIFSSTQQKSGGK